MTRVRTETRKRARSASVPSAARKKKPYKSEFETIIALKKKLRTKETKSRIPPLGYRFLEYGASPPGLIQVCNDLCLKQNFLVIIVLDANAHADPKKVSHHVNRLGCHFPSLVVDQACRRLGLVEHHGIFQQVYRPTFYDHSRISEALARHQGQGETQKQIAAAIRDIFPKMPEEDVRKITEHAFEEGSRRIGTMKDVSLARRVQLAVGAHARHMYTDYDKLLKTTRDRKHARAQVEPACRQQLMKWRGEENNDKVEFEETLREIIVIDDSDDEDFDDLDVDPGTSQGVDPHGPVEGGSRISTPGAADARRSLDLRDASAPVDDGRHLRNIPHFGVRTAHTGLTAPRVYRQENRHVTVDLTASDSDSDIEVLEVRGPPERTNTRKLFYGAPRVYTVPPQNRHIIPEHRPNPSPAYKIRVPVLQAPQMRELSVVPAVQHGPRYNSIAPQPVARPLYQNFPLEPIIDRQQPLSTRHGPGYVRQHEQPRLIYEAVPWARPSVPAARPQGPPLLVHDDLPEPRPYGPAQSHGHPRLIVESRPPRHGAPSIRHVQGPASEYIPPEYIPHKKTQPNHSLHEVATRNYAPREYIPDEYITSERIRHEPIPPQRVHQPLLHPEGRGDYGRYEPQAPPRRLQSVRPAYPEREQDIVLPSVEEQGILQEYRY